MNLIKSNIPNSINKLYNIIPVKGRGSWIRDVNNHNYLDLTSGIGALSTGHSHPLVLDRVMNQMKDIVHPQQQIYATHPSQIKLTQKLINIMPCNSLNNIFYTNSGSEATENAIKIAKRYTNKNNIIAMSGGFHGRTIGALSVSSSNLNCKFKNNGLSGVYFCNKFKPKDFDNILAYQTSVDETAAVILEPVLGEGGVYSLNKHFLKHIEKICKKNNILLITDEVQSGAGRTGTWWNVEQKNIKPDILTFGKGIGSGFPIAGLVSTCEIMNNIGNSYLGGTYGGNALVSAAASATIDVINNDNLIDNTNKMGNLLNIELTKFKEIKKVRQYGLMIAIEFHNSNRVPYIVNELKKNNILVLLCGNKSQFIRLLPPLNISKTDIVLFINTLKKIIN